MIYMNQNEIMILRYAHEASFVGDLKVMCLNYNEDLSSYPGKCIGLQANKSFGLNFEWAAIFSFFYCFVECENGTTGNDGLKCRPCYHNYYGHKCKYECVCESRQR